MNKTGKSLKFSVIIRHARGGLRLYGAPGRNLERALSIYSVYMNICNVVNRTKTLIEPTELLVLLKQMKLEQKKRFSN